MGFHRLLAGNRSSKLLPACLKAGSNLLIEGPVGVGKTRLAQEAARAMNRPTIRVDGDERYSEEKLAGWFDPPAVFPEDMSRRRSARAPVFSHESRSAAVYKRTQPDARRGSEYPLACLG